MGDSSRIAFVCYLLPQLHSLLLIIVIAPDDCKACALDPDEGFIGMPALLEPDDDDNSEDSAPSAFVDLVEDIERPSSTNVQAPPAKGVSYTMDVSMPDGTTFDAFKKSTTGPSKVDALIPTTNPITSTASSKASPMAATPKDLGSADSSKESQDLDHDEDSESELENDSLFPFCIPSTESPPLSPVPSPCGTPNVYPMDLDANGMYNF